MIEAEPNDSFPSTAPSEEEKTMAEIRETTVITLPRNLPEHVVVRVSDAFPGFITLYSGNRIRKIKIV